MMDRELSKEKISRQLELITEQFSYLKQNQGLIPQIEIDLLKKNIQKLYELMLELQKVNTIIENKTENKEETPQLVKEILEAEKQPLIVVNDNSTTTDKVMETQDSKVVENNNQEDTTQNEIEVIFTPEPKAVVQEKVVEIQESEPNPKTSAKKPHVVADLFGTSQQTIADKYKSETKSINDKIQKTKPEKSIGHRLQQNPIKDLKTAIGINEKFLFINELFKGNMKEYNETIISINNCTSHDDALKILNAMADKYNWEEEMVAYLTLKDFVERKFLK
jgi:hypothetical protein